MMEISKSFLLRINAALWREIEAWAQEDFRSVNGQVEYLLREAVRRRQGQRTQESEPETMEAPSSETLEKAEPEMTQTPPPDEGLEMGRHD